MNRKDRQFYRKYNELMGDKGVRGKKFWAGVELGKIDPWFKVYSKAMKKAKRAGGE